MPTTSANSLLSVSWMQVHGRAMHSLIKNHSTRFAQDMGIASGQNTEWAAQVVRGCCGVCRLQHMEGLACCGRCCIVSDVACMPSMLLMLQTIAVSACRQLQSSLIQYVCSLEAVPACTVDVHHWWQICLLVCAALPCRSVLIHNCCACLQVGPQGVGLKVKEPQKYNFDPKSLLLQICEVCRELCHVHSFCVNTLGLHTAEHQHCTHKITLQWSQCQSKSL